MGLSFENQLAALFETHGLAFDAQATTEMGNKPDFLFPGQLQYSDPGFGDDMLTMLAAKSVCKERWRQVLPEARRVRRKHLVTLEPGISEAQTAQMDANDVQLVVPARLHDSYAVGQREWLWTMRDFIGLVADRQSR